MGTTLASKMKGELLECSYCHINYNEGEQKPECPGCGADDPIKINPNHANRPLTKLLDETEKSKYDRLVGQIAAEQKRLHRLSVDVFRKAANLPPMDWEAEEYYRRWGHYERKPSQENQNKKPGKQINAHEEDYTEDDGVHGQDSGR